jgi:H+/Cl- antiporter ClcA
MVFALAVVGLYAQDLNKARKEHKYSDGKWVCLLNRHIANRSFLVLQVFATVVGSLSAVTALIFMILPIIVSYMTVAILFAWDIALFVLWCAVFGLFGSMYIHENAEMDSGVQRMKNAVWIDLICLLLWFITSIMGAIGFMRGRNNRTLHTGRAVI